MILPAGYLSSREAVERVGRTLSGNAWSGNELSAQIARKQFRSWGEDEYREKSEAIERWGGAVQALLKALVDGRCSAALVDRNTGKLRLCRPAFWLREGAADALSRGYTTPGHDIAVTGLEMAVVAAARPTVVPLQPQPKKAGTAARVAEFRRWVEEQTAAASRPPSVEQCAAWAAERQLSREWLRTQRQLLPQELRRRRGEHA